jgi:hypothetical protein
MAKPAQTTKGLDARDSRSRLSGVREFKSHPLHHGASKSNRRVRHKKRFQLGIRFLNKASYRLFPMPQPRLSGLLLKHIFAGAPLENLMQPQHCEKSFTPFSPRISEQSFIASSFEMGSTEVFMFYFSAKSKL